MNEYKIIFRWNGAKTNTVFYTFSDNTRDAIVNCIEYFQLSDLTCEFIRCEMVLPYEFRKPLSVI